MPNIFLASVLPLKYIFCILSVWLSRWINKCQFILNKQFVSYHAFGYTADGYTCAMSFLLIAVMHVLSICWYQAYVGWTCLCVCVCIRDAYRGCVWDAAQVSVGVCWTTSLQGTGYQAEREAIMLITLHTPCQPSVQHNCWAYTHTHTYTLTHAP